MARQIIPGSARGRAVVDWPDLFDQIHTCPGLWLGSRSATALEHFIEGIRRAEDIYEVPTERRLSGFPFAEFEEWVGHEFNHERMTIRSYHVARRRTATDSAAFLLWYDWYHRFRHERAGV